MSKKTLSPTLHLKPQSHSSHEGSHCNDLGFKEVSGWFKAAGILGQARSSVNDQVKGLGFTRLGFRGLGFKGLGLRFRAYRGPTRHLIYYTSAASQVVSLIPVPPAP